MDYLGINKTSKDLLNGHEIICSGSALKVPRLIYKIGIVT